MRYRSGAVYRPTGSRKGGRPTMKHGEHRELQEYRDRQEIDEHWPHIEMPAVAAATRYAGKQKHKQMQMQAENDTQPQLK